MKIIFFGTPHFAAEILEFLFKNNIDIVAVVSKPDKPKGRSGHPLPTAVKDVVLRLNPLLPLFQPELVSTPEFKDTLQQFQADLFVVVAYGEIIKQHLLDMPEKGCINVHASLLPKYRGAAPIQRAIMEGEKETGICIMHMVKKMDAGDVIEIARIEITPDMTFGELEKELCELAKKELLKALHDFEKGIIKRVPQDHSQATLAPKIELENCEIDWKNSAQTIHNLVRGVNPHPGAWCKVLVRNEAKRLKILRTRLHPSKKGLPGEILSQNNQNLMIATSDGALELLEIQLEGKKVMNSAELIRGLPLKELKFS